MILMKKYPECFPENFETDILPKDAKKENKSVYRVIKFGTIDRNGFMGRYIFFDKVIQIGRLYLDYIFYEFESEPILFSCVDDEKKLYLCLCSEIRYGQKWIITECELSTLKALIDEKMDIASAFLLKNEIIIIDMDLQGKESSYVIRSEEIDRLDFPKEGMYIKDNKESARNYLWNKRNFLSGDARNANVS